MVEAWLRHDGWGWDGPRDLPDANRGRESTGNLCRHGVDISSAVCIRVLVLVGTVSVSARFRGFLEVKSGGFFELEGRTFENSLRGWFTN